MSNFYTDNDDLKFRFENFDFKRSVEIREGNYGESKQYDFAPTDFADTIDSYRRLLEIAGDVTGNGIAPNAEQIDREGHIHENWQVQYHPKVLEAMKLFTQADLMALTQPRRYGGLNVTATVSTMIVEMLARADGGLMTVLGLQDIADTVYHFGNEAQCREYLPKFAAGATGAMVLTEPDAGSDLQAVMLSATPETDDDGVWRLKGVKRFITNGCGDILLVMARSEPNTTDARGISLFVCEKDPTVKIRRIEDKLGIHSSPTCEIQFENTPAYLIGKRRYGLIKYVMSLMNGARLGIAAQSVGIAEAAYREARNYAEKREQFGEKIRAMPAVYDMLIDMRANIEAARALLYDTTLYVEISKTLNKNMELSGSKDSDLKAEVKYNTQKADLLTPLVKFYATEMVNDVCNKAIQILGGSGYMRDYPVERYYRDARITNIYEGTTQLQVVAAFPRIMKGELDDLFEAFLNQKADGLVGESAEKIKACIPQLRACIETVKAVDSREYSNFYARAIVDICADIYLSMLLLRDAKVCARKEKVARMFISKALPRIAMHVQFVQNKDMTAIEHYQEVIGEAQLD